MRSIEQALRSGPKRPGAIRVAILADISPHALGGRANGRGAGHNVTWLPQLGDAFAGERELDAWWVSYDRGARAAEVARRAGQHFIRLPLFPIRLGLALNLLPYRLELLDVLRRIRPDVVHVWGTERVYATVLAGVRVPSVLSMQGILTELKRIGCLPRGCGWRTMARHEPAWLRAADVVTSESTWGRDVLSAIAPAAAVRVIQYGVHPSFYDVRWRPDPARPVALYCGTLSRGKGADILLEALARLPNRRWECRIAGDGPLRAAFERARLARVRLLGTLAWDALQEEYARAWCLVLPTLADSSPNAVKEARVVGLPVVTTLRGGQRDYVHDGENGLIVEPPDAARLAERLSRIMSDYRLAARMGGIHHRRDRDALRPEATTRAFVALYREVAGSGRAREAA